MISKGVDVLGTIVVLAIITTLVLPKRQTPAVISAAGGAFSNAITAAMGGNTAAKPSK